MKKFAHCIGPAKVLNALLDCNTPSSEPYVHTPFICGLSKVTHQCQALLFLYLLSIKISPNGGRPARDRGANESICLLADNTLAVSQAGTLIIAGLRANTFNDDDKKRWNF